MKLTTLILFVLTALPLSTKAQRPQHYSPPTSPIPSGIPKMAQDHLAKARKLHPDAYLVSIKVHNYLVVHGQPPQHGVYGVHLTYYSPKSGSYIDYVVGPGQDALQQGVPPGSTQVAMLPLRFVDLPQALSALQQQGAGDRIQYAYLRYIAGDQPNIYAVWDIHTLGRHTKPLYVLADSGKVVDLAFIHPHAVRGDPDVWLENLLAENLRKLNEQQQQSSSQSGSGRSGYPGVPPCYAAGGMYTACIGHQGIATNSSAERSYKSSEGSE